MRFWRARACEVILSSAAVLPVMALPNIAQAQFPASSDITAPGALDGTNGFAFDDGSFFNRRSVSSAGDVNGDGIDDVIIGGVGGREEAFVVFGSTARFDAILNFGSLDGTNGFTITGGTNAAVSGAGDINGDGVDDLIIGSPSEGGAFTTNSPDYTTTGQHYVVFGDSGGFNATLDISSLDGTNGFAINGVDVGVVRRGRLLGAANRYNSSVSGAGDINGDGFDDLIIGDRNANPTGDTTDRGFPANSGASFVVFGGADNVGGAVDLETLGSADGFVFNGVDSDAATGQSVSNAGDVNGDGIDDVVIGAPGVGSSFVLFGNTDGFNSPLDPSVLDGTNGFVIQGETFSGSAVSGAGDVNGDGFDDLIIGAYDPSDFDSPATAFLVFGSAAGSDVTLDSLDGTDGFLIEDSLNPNSGFGNTVSGAGDINGDGFDDLIIGAESFYGTTVVFGGADGFNAVLDVATLDGTNGFELSNLPNTSVSGAGDINGDGIDDLIIGTYLGGNFIVFGQAVPEPSSGMLVFGGLLGWLGLRRRK